MRELLLLFILAVIVGSIINGWPKEQPMQKNNNQVTSLSPGERRDFPDFNAFPAVNDVNFNNLVLNNIKTVLVVCYTPDNTSCERMIPLVAALAQDHADAISVARLNVVGNDRLVSSYRIRLLPTFLIFNQGKLVAQITGVVPKDQLEATLLPYLKTVEDSSNTASKG